MDLLAPLDIAKRKLCGRRPRELRESYKRVNRELWETEKRHTGQAEVVGEGVDGVTTIEPRRSQAATTVQLGQHAREPGVAWCELGMAKKGLKGKRARPRIERWLGYDRALEMCGRAVKERCDR